MKALAGIKMSFRLQRLLFPDLSKPIRGFREEDSCLSLNAYLYTVLRANRSQRRGFIQTLLNLFDDSAVSAVHHILYSVPRIFSQVWGTTFSLKEISLIFVFGCPYIVYIFFKSKFKKKKKKYHLHSWLIKEESVCDLSGCQSCVNIICYRRCHWRSSSTLWTTWPSSLTWPRTNLCLSSTR